MFQNEHDKIIIPIINGLEFVSPENIVSVHSDGNYTNFILSDKSKLQSSHTLKFFEPALTEHGFIRVHESNIINPAYVKSYIKGDGGLVVMKNGSEVSVARNRKYEFLLAIAIRWGSPALFARIVNHFR